MTETARTRGDLCPGVLRPWPADDGALVRLRLVGGAISRATLVALGDVASAYGDGNVHLTKRANLQLRGLPLGDGCLPGEVIEAITATGLLPSQSHELVRNIVVSPLSGISGGRADLRPVAHALDVALCASPELAALPGRFLFVLDDGRGDVAWRPLDLGLLALSATTAQLRVGSRGWGSVVHLDLAHQELLTSAHAFLAVRGSGKTAAWHVDELAVPLGNERRDPLTDVASSPLPYGLGDGYQHIEVPGGVLTPSLLAALPAVDRLIVTPWHGLLFGIPLQGWDSAD